MWSSLPCSQQHVTSRALRRISPRTPTAFISDPFLISLYHPRQGLPDGAFLQVSPSKLKHSYFICPSVRPSKQCFRDPINCQHCTVKVKVTLEQITQAKRGKQMYSSTLPSTSALDGVGSQRHAPAALPRERPGTHFIGGWVGTQGPV
jgi:hypothetical protein